MLICVDPFDIGEVCNGGMPDCYRCFIPVPDGEERSRPNPCFRYGEVMRAIMISTRAMSRRKSPMHAVIRGDVLGARRYYEVSVLLLSVIVASVEASERYLAGVMPVLFLNAVQKTLSQEKPVRKQISLTDNVVVFNR